MKRRRGQFFVPDFGSWAGQKDQREYGYWTENTQQNRIEWNTMPTTTKKDMGESKQKCIFQNYEMTWIEL